MTARPAKKPVPTGDRASISEARTRFSALVERLRGLAPHHEDPFDRMLIAPALHEGAILVTAGRDVARDGVRLTAA